MYRSSTTERKGTNAGRLQLWINGVQQTATTFFGTIPSSMQFTGTSHLFRVGASTGGALFAPFDYADTRLYVQRALTGRRSTISITGSKTSALLRFWYRYAEGSGTVVNDSAGTNTGTSANATYISLSAGGSDDRQISARKTSGSRTDPRHVGRRTEKAAAYHWKAYETARALLKGVTLSKMRPKALRSTIRLFRPREAKDRGRSDRREEGVTWNMCWIGSSAS